MKMRGYLIDATNHAVSEVSYDGIEELWKHLNCHTLGLIPTGTGENVYFDEEATFRKCDHGFIMSTSPIRIRGNGLWVGPIDWKGDELFPKTPIEQVRSMITFVGEPPARDEPEQMHDSVQKTFNT